MRVGREAPLLPQVRPGMLPRLLGQASGRSGASQQVAHRLASDASRRSVALFIEGEARAEL